nr:alpha/beta hydrolase [Alphaproteobacteria bacterium]
MFAQQSLSSGHISYLQQSGAQPGVIFLHGFKSDMLGGKATALAEFCTARGQAFLRFDCRAHGQSDGDFSDFTIGGALEDTLHMLDNLTTGPQILVGSSMGGWLAFLCALHRPQRIKAIIGIAPAPDFTDQ